jgi:hypothetical protein
MPTILPLQSVKRPAIEELEKIPKVRAIAKESSLVVKEYSLNHQQTSKMREWKAKEDDLIKREAAVAAAEKALREKEAVYAAKMTDLQRREAALAARLGNLADEENRRYSMGDRPRSSSGTSGSGLPAPGAGIPLHRAHSMSDVMQGPAVVLPVPELKRGRSMSTQGVNPFLGHAHGIPSEIHMTGATAPIILTSTNGSDSIGVSGTTLPSSRPSTAGSVNSFSGFGAAAISTPHFAEDTEMSGVSTPSYLPPTYSFRPSGNHVSNAFSGASMAAKVMPAEIPREQPRHQMGL